MNDFVRNINVLLWLGLGLLASSNAFAEPPPLRLQHPESAIAMPSPTLIVARAEVYDALSRGLVTSALEATGALGSVPDVLWYGHEIRDSDEDWLCFRANEFLSAERVLAAALALAQPTSRAEIALAIADLRLRAARSFGPFPFDCSAEGIDVANRVPDVLGSFLQDEAISVLVWVTQQATPATAASAREAWRRLASLRPHAFTPFSELFPEATLRSGFKRVEFILAPD